MADQAVGELDDAFGNTAVEHQLPGEDEKGDGQEAEDLHAANHLLEDDGHRQIGGQDGGHAAQTDGKGHRHAQDQQQREADAQDGQFHAGSTTLPCTSATMCSTENSTISTPPITIGT